MNDNKDIIETSTTSRVELLGQTLVRFWLQKQLCLIQCSKFHLSAYGDIDILFTNIRRE